MLRIFRRLVILLLIFSCGCGGIPKYKVINSPLPSNEIIFIKYTGRTYGHIDKSEIWAMDRDGKNQVKLGEILVFVGSISYSPDEKKIVYDYSPKHNYSPKHKVYEMCMIEFNDDEIRYKKILRNNYPIYYISLSQNGQKIVFEMEDSKDKRNIYIIDSNGENLKRLTNYDDWQSSPSWSPNGEKIVFNRHIMGEGWKIHLIDADGTHIERLTNNYSPDVEERSPTWSPDGKWIAFEETNFNYKKVKESIHIVLINPKTKERYEFPSLIPQKLLTIRSMCFSPDGKKIAFEGEDYSKYDEYGRSNIEIYTIDIDGKNLKNLTNTPEGAELNPSWRSIVKK